MRFAPLFSTSWRNRNVPFSPTRPRHAKNVPLPRSPTPTPPHAKYATLPRSPTPTPRHAKNVPLPGLTHADPGTPNLLYRLSRPTPAPRDAPFRNVTCLLFFGYHAHRHA